MRVWDWSLVNLLVEINAIMQQTPKLQLSSTTLSLIISQNYNRSMNPLVKGCIKERCGREYLEMSKFHTQ